MCQTALAFFTYPIIISPQCVHTQKVTHIFTFHSSLYIGYVIKFAPSHWLKHRSAFLTERVRRKRGQACWGKLSRVIQLWSWHTASNSRFVGFYRKCNSPFIILPSSEYWLHRNASVNIYICVHFLLHVHHLLLLDDEIDQRLTPMFPYWNAIRKRTCPLSTIYDFSLFLFDHVETARND